MLMQKSRKAFYGGTISVHIYAYTCPYLFGIVNLQKVITIVKIFANMTCNMQFDSLRIFFL